jgi:prolycopene isomerase
VALTGDIDLDNLQLDDIDRLYGEVRSGKVADVTPIYAPVPTNFDASLAPDGAQLITACAVAPTTDIDLVDAPQLWVDNMMRALRGLLPGLDDALLWVDTWTVAAIGQWAGKLHAPAVSTGQVTGQVGNHRPPVRTPIRGLYACGCNAGARGIGTELAAASGEQAADAVVCDLVNGLLPEATV